MDEDLGASFWSVAQHLQAEGLLCDIQLCVPSEGDPENMETIYAHKLILVASSRFFQQAVGGGQLLDVYNFVGISRVDLQTVVDYMYRRVSLEELLQNGDAAVAAQTIQIISHDEQYKLQHLQQEADQIENGCSELSEQLSENSSTKSEEPTDPTSRYHPVLNEPLQKKTTQTNPVATLSSHGESNPQVENNAPANKNSHRTSFTVTLPESDCTGNADVSSAVVSESGVAMDSLQCLRTASGRPGDCTPAALAAPSTHSHKTVRRVGRRQRRQPNYRLLAEGFDEEEQEEGEAKEEGQPKEAAAAVMMNSVNEAVDTNSQSDPQWEGTGKRCQIRTESSDPDFSITAALPPLKRRRGRPPKVRVHEQSDQTSAAPAPPPKPPVTQPPVTSTPVTQQGQLSSGSGDAIDSSIKDRSQAEGGIGDLGENKSTCDSQGREANSSNVAGASLDGTANNKVQGSNPALPFPCVRCRRSFKSSAAVAQHCKVIHNMATLHGCTACGREFKSMGALMRHKASDHEMALYRCGDCEQAFKTREGLKFHQQKKHSTEAPTHLCKLCGKAFYLKGELRSHMQYRHSESRDFCCEKCPRAFKSKALLVRHLNTFHSSVRRFQCDVCNTMFKTRNDCKAHREKHFRIRNPIVKGSTRGKRFPDGEQYPCQYCGKVFQKRAHQMVHENLQHKQKNDGTSYLCTVCSKLFPIKHYLMQHIKNCHSERRFPCHSCGHSFAQHADLKKHQSTPGRCKGVRTEPKPFSCPQCGRGFSLKGNLSKHLQRPGRCRGATANPEVIVVFQQTEGEEGGKEEVVDDEDPQVSEEVSAVQEELVVVAATPGGEEGSRSVEGATVPIDEVKGPVLENTVTVDEDGVYHLHHPDGALSLQGIVDGKVLPLSLSQLAGQMQFRLAGSEPIAEEQIITYHTEQGVPIPSGVTTPDTEEHLLVDGSLISSTTGEAVHPHRDVDENSVTDDSPQQSDMVLSNQLTSVAVHPASSGGHGNDTALLQVVDCEVMKVDITEQEIVDDVIIDPKVIHRDVMDHYVVEQVIDHEVSVQHAEGEDIVSSSDQPGQQVIVTQESSLYLSQPDGVEAVFESR